MTMVTTTLKTNLYRPKAVKKGDTLGVVAPARWLDDSALETGVKAIEELGFQVKVHPHCYKRNHHFAGTDATRAAALADAFRDPQIDGIICARGGTGSMRLHTLLDGDSIAKHPKALSGFSDITALHYILRQQSNLITYHGPLVWNFATYNDEWTNQVFKEVMGHKQANLTHPQAKPLRIGNAEGPLIGGNISLLCSLLGTPYAPDVTGAILFIEDIDEELARIDRQLQQLAAAGWFDKIAGLIIGESVTLDTLFGTPFGQSFEEQLLSHIPRSGVPVIYNYPCGHTKSIATFPIGLTARLQTHMSSYTLELPQE